MFMMRTFVMLAFNPGIFGAYRIVNRTKLIWEDVSEDGSSDMQVPRGITLEVV